MELWNAYTMKTSWYKLQDTLPETVWTWLSSTVKKNSSLPKRLLRIFEYWLMECKDWDGLKKKVKVLIVDYLSRKYLEGGVALSTAK